MKTTTTTKTDMATIIKTDVIGLRKYLNSHKPTKIRYNDDNHDKAVTSVFVSLTFDELIIMPQEPSTVYLKGKCGQLSISGISSVIIGEWGMVGTFVTLKSALLSHPETYKLWLI